VKSRRVEVRIAKVGLAAPAHLRARGEHIGNYGDNSLLYLRSTPRSRRTLLPDFQRKRWLSLTPARGEYPSACVSDL